MVRISFLLLLTLAQTMQAQMNRIRSYEAVLQKQSLAHGVAFRNIGPSIMGGRVTDVSVNPANSNEFVLAYASGGLWYTQNNGHSLTPLFDKEATMTLGAVAVDWQRGKIWVGTGEVNSSRSSYAGVGVYVSEDFGKTWQHKGLAETHHIGKVWLHPSKPNTAWVAAMGHLYSKNPERGVFKTTDGGATWQQVLIIDDSTGCVDIAMDPRNPDVLYAATWTRIRRAWHFTGSGPGSAIYKSTDGGNQWTLLSDAASGFPKGDHVGRIGLSIATNQPQTLYALLDNQAHQIKKKEEDQEDKGLTPKQLLTMSEEDFLQLDVNIINTYLKKNRYPAHYNGQSLKKAIRRGDHSVAAIAHWKLGDANQDLFDTPVIGAELYRSDDGGKSWRKTHEGSLDGLYYSYGYYFGTIAVSPLNADRVAIAGVGLLLSDDGGRNFREIDGENCHADYHRIWFNPQHDAHLIVANDGGANISYDAGKNWYKVNNPAVGQFYAVQVDQQTPYNVYGGLQDNGTWKGPSTHSENVAWHQEGRYAYESLGGGDGMQVQVDSRDPKVYYYGYQFGNYFRANADEDDLYITPSHEIGEPAYRFNWQTPIQLSKHNEDHLYMGSQYLMRSTRKGEAMRPITPDLSHVQRKGNVPYHTITSIDESALVPGLLYVGTDHGEVYRITQQGQRVQALHQSLPHALWVSRIIASEHDPHTVYLTLNGYRNDDFTPYVYVSKDQGDTWTRIALDLPLEPVNVIREDPKHADILYIGTDNGLYLSVDKGRSTHLWNAGLPRVAIHDMIIQERDNELVLGTHGRSIYIAPLHKIQQLPSLTDSTLYVFPMPSITYQKKLGTRPNSYLPPLHDSVDISFFAQQAQPCRVAIIDSTGTELLAYRIQALAGINTLRYSQEIAPANCTSPRPDGKCYLPPGQYTIEVSDTKGLRASRVWHIKNP